MVQKYVKNEKRYRLINFICLLAVYKKLIGTGRVLGTSILRYGVVQTHVYLKHKMGYLVNTDRGLAVGLLQVGVSKQGVCLHCSLFLANGLPKLIDFYTLSV